MTSLEQKGCTGIDDDVPAVKRGGGNTLRVFFLTRYGYEGASSRYRMFLFLPHLMKQGFDCHVSPFFESGYTNLRFSGDWKTLLYRTVEDYFRRFKTLKDSCKADVIFVEKEILPYIPSMIEQKIIPKEVPLVCDYDDAWFHIYDDSRSIIIRRLFSNKIPSLMKRAAAVITGSNYLHDFSIRHNPKTYLVPTVINTDLYPEEPPVRNPEVPFSIGWIGSHTTVAHLKIVEQALDEFCKTHNARVVVIGARESTLEISNVVEIPWTESSEVESVSGIDVGIMPLPDTSWARGKCAFKLIQYMGCWKPVITSPVGESAIVVRNGVNGFLAGTGREWIDALESLYADEKLRATMGLMGRALVEEKYSLRVRAPQLEAILREASGTG